MKRHLANTTKIVYMVAHGIEIRGVEDRMRFSHTVAFRALLPAPCKHAASTQYQVAFDSTSGVKDQPVLVL